MRSPAPAAMEAASHTAGPSPWCRRRPERPWPLGRGGVIAGKGLPLLGFADSGPNAVPARTQTRRGTMVPMAAALDDHIHDYIAHLAVERNLSPRTLDSYARDLRQFSAWAADEKLDPASIARAHIRSYIGHRRDGGLSPRSSARRRGCTAACRQQEARSRPSISSVIQTGSTRCSCTHSRSARASRSSISPTCSA